MARPTNREDRRAQISIAAIRVVASRGFAGASVASIAEEAGLTAGLVHYHFKSKEEVLLAAMAHVEALVARREAHFLESVNARDPRAALGARIDAYLARGPLADPDAVAFWVAAGAEALSRPEVARAYRAAVDRAIGVLAARLEAVRAARRRPYPEGGARRDAAAVYASIEGLFRLAALAPESIPEGSAAGLVRAAAEGLLRARS